MKIKFNSWFTVLHLDKPLNTITVFNYVFNHFNRLQLRWAEKILPRINNDSSEENKQTNKQTKFGTGGRRKFCFAPYYMWLKCQLVKEREIIIFVFRLNEKLQEPRCLSQATSDLCLKAILTGGFQPLPRWLYEQAINFRNSHIQILFHIISQEVVNGVSLAFPLHKLCLTTSTIQVGGDHFNQTNRLCPISFPVALFPTSSPHSGDEGAWE